MRRIWGIRHLRYWYYAWQIKLWYRLWAEHGYFVRPESDEAMLDAIWRGVA